MLDNSFLDGVQILQKKLLKDVKNYWFDELIDVLANLLTKKDILTNFLT